MCSHGWGYPKGSTDTEMRSFPQWSIGRVRDRSDGFIKVWLIGIDEVWVIPASECEVVELAETGDKFDYKVCNICHRYLSVTSFARNQNNVHGIVRRPSCVRCRTDIDKRAPKSAQAKRKEKERPRKGDPFRCPICRKMRIAGITVKVVADHDHNTGNIRDFVCDSCNTGLGRFKNGVDYLRNAIAYVREHDTLD